MLSVCNSAKKKPPLPHERKSTAIFLLPEVSCMVCSLYFYAASFRFFPPLFMAYIKEQQLSFPTLLPARKQVMFIGLKHGLYRNIHGTQSWRNHHSTCSYRAMIPLGSQRHGGNVCMTRTQHWRDTHPLGRTEGMKSMLYVKDLISRRTTKIS